MKTSLNQAILLLFIFTLSLPSGFAWAQAKTLPPEDCVDEICDGLDNDCDKAIDDFVDCGADLLCACGKCANAAPNGQCSEGTLFQGHCVVDHCPTGLKCNMGTGKCRRI